jgi:hypothetical protein
LTVVAGWRVPLEQSKSGAMSANPLARLRHTANRFDFPLRMELFALGADLVPALIGLVEERDAGWARVHAVDMLIDLRAEEAIVPMLRTIASIGYDDALSGYGDLEETLDRRIRVRLPELGRAVLEPALAFLGEHAEEAGAVYETCDMLVALGIKDDRIFEGVKLAFGHDTTLGAGNFATYGDSRACRIIEDALATMVPDLTSVWGNACVEDLLLAHRRLGGVLGPEVRERVEGWLAEWDPQWPS